MRLDWELPPFPPRATNGPITSVSVAWQCPTNDAPVALQAIPSRDPLCRSNLVDLSAFYNASPRDSWHGFEKNDLSALPTGVQRLDGTDFDVRGIVQLAATTSALLPCYPKEVSGIPINFSCRRLHFLHAAGWSAGAGAKIAEYVIHYRGGERASVPLIFGQNIMGWWADKLILPPANESTRIAWTGTNAAAAKAKNEIRLCRFTWENPRPDVAIDTIDFISAMTKAAPFLLAITAE